MAEQRVIVLVGLPASGKSTWAARLGVTAISSDELRRWLRDDPTDQSIHGRVFRWMRDLLRERIELGMPLSVVDATNLTRKHRRAFVRIAQHTGCRCEAVFFDLPLDECLRRNQGRDRRVPDEAIRSMAERLEPPREDEGFGSVTRVDT